MSIPLAALLQLSSSALPVGGFAYSRGLEMAVELGWVADAPQASSWIGGLLRHATATLDAPLVHRLHRAFQRGDRTEVERWARFAVAARESAELRRESAAMGRALARLLVELDLAREEELAGPVREAHVASFALAALRFGLPCEVATRSYLWVALDGAVSAAVKLVPLGQTQGQRLLLELGRELDGLAEYAASLQDHELGAFAPSLAVASALHETQHTRLFRS